MTQQATMPEPVAYAHRDILRRGNAIERIHPTAKYGDESIGLITTTQAEAYAAAKVREALEQALCEIREHAYPRNPRRDWTEFAEGGANAVERMETCLRGLIPDNSRPGQP